MRDHEPVVVAIDGPPGAGKTSLLARLVPAHGDDCMFFTEPNARLAEELFAPVHASTAAHSLWFLRHEAAKARRISALLGDPLTRLLLCDRNHLGALAFCHATRASDALPYQRALGFYRTHVAPHLPQTMRTVILGVSPQVSLARRGGTAELPRWAQWFSPDLLDRLHNFYLTTAPGLCPNPPLVIDTDHLTAGEVHDQVAALLTDAGLPTPAGPAVPLWPQVDRPELDPAFTGLYADAGGLETLGHPLTGTFGHRGGLLQICQLATLHRDPEGGVGVWNLLAEQQAAR